MQQGETIGRRFVLTAPRDYDLDGIQAWLAHDSRTDTDVAVYLIEADHSTHLHRELASTQSVRHQAIPRTLATGHDPESTSATYFVTSHAKGTVLGDVTADHRLPLDVASSIVSSAARTVRDVHRKGLIHGRLRPASLTITRRGKVFVTGWGLDQAVWTGHGKAPRPSERDDAVALATIYARAVTGLDLTAINVRELPEALTSDQHDLIAAVVRGRGPRTVDDVLTALGAPVPTRSASLVTQWSSYLLTPAREAERAARIAAEAKRVRDEAAAIPLSPSLGVVGAALLDAWEFERLAPGVDWSAIRAAMRGASPSAPALADPDNSLLALRAMVDAQSTVEDTAIWESLVERLHHQWPQSDALTRTWEWANRQSHRTSQLNPGPLLISTFITALIITGMLAFQSMTGPWEPDFPRYNPGPQTYPPFTYSPDATAVPSISPEG